MDEIEYQKAQENVMNARVAWKQALKNVEEGERLVREEVELGERARDLVAAHEDRIARVKALRARAKEVAAMAEMVYERAQAERDAIVDAE